MMPVGIIPKAAVTAAQDEQQEAITMIREHIFEKRIRINDMIGPSVALNQGSRAFPRCSGSLEPTE